MRRGQLSKPTAAGNTLKNALFPADSDQMKRGGGAIIVRHETFMRIAWGCDGRRYLPRTVRTGHGDVAITREATLPNRNRERPVRPRVPITMRSVRLTRAAWTIRSAGLPSRILTAAFAPAARARTTSSTNLLRAAVVSAAANR